MYFSVCLSVWFSLSPDTRARACAFINTDLTKQNTTAHTQSVSAVSMFVRLLDCPCSLHELLMEEFVTSYSGSRKVCPISLISEILLINRYQCILYTSCHHMIWIAPRQYVLWQRLTIWTFHLFLSWTALFEVLASSRINNMLELTRFVETGAI